jgi:hypothetical protein
MSNQFHNGEDRELHSDAIHALSERYHVDESTIREMYESKLEELRYHATITSFLPVLIERHVKNLLQYTPDFYS